MPPVWASILRTSHRASKKIFIMRTDKDLPLKSNIEVYAEDDEFMPLTNEKTLSKKAARCVLNYLPKLSAGDTSWLLREACETLHPKADRAFRAEQLPGILKDPIGVTEVLNR